MHGPHLPTELEVLRHFHYLHCERKIKKRKSAIETAKAVETIWIIRHIETQKLYRAADKVEKLVKEYEGKKKRCKDPGVLVRQKHLSYLDKLTNETFDISKMLNVLGIDERNVHEEHERQEEPHHNGESMQEVHEQEQAHREPIRDLYQIPGGSNTNTPLVIVRELSNQSRISENVNNNMANETQEQCRRNTAPICDYSEARPDKNVCLMFDHIGASHKDACLAYITIAKSLGVHDNDIVCSSSTMFRTREHHRKVEANSIQENFDPSGMNTIHWDGKTYHSRGGVRDKRLTVVLSNSSKAKSLEITHVHEDNAKVQSKAVFDICRKWNILENVNSMSFDAARTNTGKYKGVCKTFQTLVKKDLLYLPCRHHIYEIVSTATFAVTIETPDMVQGPKTKSFEAFSHKYYSEGFDRNNYNSCRKDKFFLLLLGTAEMDRLSQMCQESLETITTRSDYVEFLKLIVIFFSPQCDYEIRAPGAYNRARFMCRIIYVLKMYLYRKQLAPTFDEFDAMRRFLLFSVKIYVPYWLKTSSAVKAPNSDLNMLKDMMNLSEAIPNTIRAAMGKMVNHLWYLSQTLVALSFFDDDVPVDVKLRMVERMNHPTISEDLNRAELNEPQNVQNLDLADFVSSATKRFFTITGINSDFLSLHPAEWNNNEQFLEARQRASNLSVVNDAAERSIALFQTYKDRVKKPEQKHYLVQVAEKRRFDYKQKRKSDVLRALR